MAQGKPPTRRQLGLEIRFTARKYRPYTTAIGEANLSWNDLHEELGLLFVTVLGGGVANLPLEIWHAIRNDRTQREILSAAVHVQYGGANTTADKLYFNALRHLLTEAQKLEDDRNNAIHSPLASTNNKSPYVYPLAAFGNRRAQRLQGQDILKEYRRLRDTAIMLRDYAGQLGTAISREHTTLPKTPRPPKRPAPKKP